MDKTVVGLNVATRSCNVYPDKCWSAVLCPFWLQCSRSLIDEESISSTQDSHVTNSDTLIIQQITEM